MAANFDEERKVITEFGERVGGDHGLRVYRNLGQVLRDGVPVGKQAGKAGK